MEEARQMLEELSQEEIESVSDLPVFLPPESTHSLYERFTLKGIRVDRVDADCVFCTFKVPARLTNATGNLCSGAIASLIDAAGGAVVYVDGLPPNVSVDMSISYLSTAKANDELEIISRALGRKGGYSGTSVLLRNKSTGQLIAEGRHSLFATTKVFEEASLPVSDILSKNLEKMARV